MFCVLSTVKKKYNNNKPLSKTTKFYNNYLNFYNRLLRMFIEITNK